MAARRAAQQLQQIKPRPLCRVQRSSREVTAGNTSQITGNSPTYCLDKTRLLTSLRSFSSSNITSDTAASGCSNLPAQHLLTSRSLAYPIRTYTSSTFLASETAKSANEPSSDAAEARDTSSAGSSDSDPVMGDEDGAVAPKRTALDGTAPRFYKRASAAPAAEGGGWVVKLDHRVLKTPAKKPLKVPTEALALAIAAEWEWQEGRHLRPYTMPLMKLAATTIDQVSGDKDTVIASLLKYFHSDSVCVRAPPSLLAEKQVHIWDPLLDWVEEEVGIRPTASSDLFAPDQSEATVEAMGRALGAVNEWQLAAIDSLAGTARSLVIGLAVAKERLGISEAIQAIRLEEDFQVEEWGFVEGGHDVDISDLRVRIAAPSVFLRLLHLH